MTTEPSNGANTRVSRPLIQFAVTATAVFLLWAAPIALLTPPDVYNVIYLAPGVFLGLLLGFLVIYRGWFSLLKRS